MLKKVRDTFYFKTFNINILLIVHASGSPSLMVCGPFIETLITSGPLRGFEIFFPHDKSIDDLKKRSSTQFEWIFPNFHPSSKQRIFSSNVPLGPPVENHWFMLS